MNVGGDDCGGADGQGGDYPDINCWYWVDRSPVRRMESYFPGWAYNYSYNFAEVSKTSKEFIKWVVRYFLN